MLKTLSSLNLEEEIKSEIGNQVNITLMVYL
jgi:hypothetical protein